MDLATLGGLMLGVAAIASAGVTFVGKRGENHTTRLNSTMDQIQEERDGYRTQVAEKNEQIAALLEQRVADQVEIARLTVKIINLGGEP